MFKCFLLFFFICMFYGAKTELDPGFEVSPKNVASSSSSTYSSAYSYVITKTKKTNEVTSEHLEHTADEGCTDESESNTAGNMSTHQCSGVNESLQCVRSCPPLRTCDNRNKRFHCLVKSTVPCKYVCACDKGFYRNPDGYCVTSDLCDKKCSGPNEEFKPDKKKCPSELCSSIVSRFACDPKEEGQPGCVCKSGFLRMDLNSTCIPTRQCPELANLPEKCTRPNESLKCVKSCPRTRTCFGRKIRYKCPNLVTEVCKNECVCDDGFYRNIDGFCVTSDLCDKKCTGANEEYKPDKKSCPPEICRSIVTRYKCDSKEVGQPGCVCKPGYLRLDLNSTCIPIELCPELKNSPDYNPNNCSGPNESSKCVKTCPPPRTCQNRGVVFNCYNNDTEICKNKCICDDGFYRNDDGFCVTSEICDIPKCLLPNESLKCVKTCQPAKTCENRNAIYECFNSTNDICKIECVCNDGYYRNSDGFCVTSEICENKTCGTDEIWNQCPSESCEYCPTCDAEARACVSASPDACSLARCTCRNNYRRAYNGSCIPTRECPAFDCSGPNEQFDACPLCPSDDCSRATPDGRCPRIGRIGIPLQCRPSCRCKPGFWRDGEICVPYETCPNIQNSNTCSGPNESLKCVKSCPPLRTCQNRNILFNCYNIEAEICKNKCVCDNGFYRNDDGICVTSKICDLNKCTGPYESPKCVKSCPPPRTCQNRGICFNCYNNETEICNNKCVCDDGFYRNDDGFCVTSELCDKKCSGPNEEYKPDKKKCPPEICQSILANDRCDPKEKGEPGCGCKVGYLRRDFNSSCIPTEECPELAESPDDCS